MKGLSLGALALISTLNGTPALAQKSTSEMTQDEIHAELVAICNNPKIMEHIVNTKGMCEYSTDNGINWYPLGIGTSLLALIAAGAIFRSRKRKVEPQIIQNNEITSENIAPDLFDGIPQDESGDHGEIDETLDEEDIEKDPIKIAAIHIAYGQLDQAEEILIKELKENPENTKTHIKLLELYYKTRNIKNFEDTFFLYKSSHPESGIPEEELGKIRGWGQEIDPANPLYIIEKVSQPTEVKVSIEPEDPNKTIEVLFESSGWNRRVESLELRTITDALNTKMLSEENILRASQMIVTTYNQSTNHEHQINVEVYLDKIAQIYTQRGEYDTAANYFLSTLTGSRHTKKIHAILLELAPHIQVKETFRQIYENLVIISGKKISESDIEKLILLGNVIDPKNSAFEAAPGLKGKQETTINAKDPIEGTPAPDKIQKEIVPITKPDVEKVTETILKTNDKGQKKIDGFSKPSLLKRIQGIFKKNASHNEGGPSQSPVRIRETYAIPGKKIESTAEVVKAKDLGVGYPEAVIRQLNKLGFDIAKSTDGKTVIITNTEEGNHLKYDPNPNIKKGQNEQNKKEEFHINNAVSLLYTTRQGVPTIIVRSSSGKPSLIEIIPKS